MIVKSLIILVFMASLTGIYMMGHRSGYNQATVKYEQRIQAKDNEIEAKNQKVERALMAVKRHAAKKITQVEQHFIPVEREVVRYVSKKEPTPCQSDYSEWMQLHNQAASGLSETDPRGRLSHDTATGKIGNH
ncbi:hypothetical protein [Photobacterium phosphoreum]|uniref:hypothetical protein n=1 Tax=Photobacterium phosphoreum TaxID=659 RepID=UPI001E331267|nr:hypothetical protein [Photobacterium phosphoreum]MCD9474066.1 hypothetical protein [Photobacterium phosphoreum]MCD9518166.1 hypothetical protein [Photobacterium phosphoreum]MCF2174458.1 hypothetical protein [Photobacterium phosphoreum]